MTYSTNERESGVGQGSEHLERAQAAQAGFLLTIGDIGVTPDWVVTPNGNAPVRGSQWIFTDMTRTESNTPTWAIICAIVFSLACLIGLFFLLVKEQQITGYAEITVRSGNLFHKTQVPISYPAQVQQVRALVSHAQSIAAQGR